MKGCLLLTACDTAHAVQLVQRALALDGAHWTVFARDEDRAALAAFGDRIVLRPDKPAGGRFAFVRALRAERFDLLWVAWQDGERTQPLKLVAWFAGARHTVAFDENNRPIAVAWWWPLPAAAHLIGRLLSTRAETLLGAGCAVYRWTIGLLVAAVLRAGTWLRRGAWLRRSRDRRMLSGPT